MKIIIDATILISVIISNSSINRELLLSSHHIFYSPSYIKEEIKNNCAELIQKTGLSLIELKILINTLYSYIRIIPLQVYRPFLKEAYSIMKDIDEKDSPYIALALAIKDIEGIWSNNGHFERQDKVKIFKIKDLK